MLNGNDTAEQQRERLMVVLALIAGAFALIAIHLYTMQVVKHEEYLSRSEKNAMRTVPIAAVRGRILDRNGNIIVGNRPAYTVGVIPAEVDDVAALDSALSDVLDIPAGTLLNKVNGRRRTLRRPIELRRDTPFASVAYLEEHRQELPAVLYFVESRRRYPYGGMAAHTLGYVREVRESQLASLRNRGYALGDLMGQSGIEAAYESYLRGHKGEEFQEVTVSGHVLNSHRKESVRGSDVRLSIDLELQQVAENAMNRVQRGALVAMDPRNGEILAMVSRPSFSPAVFSFVVPTKGWRRLNDNVERPLFNRAVMGTYPPGSTAKMISAISAIENGLIDSTTLLAPCKGAMWYGDRLFSCWYGKGHGALNVVEAIERPCNIFFYQIGRDLGIDKWAATARKFGLGEKTGVDLPTEEDGLVASTEVYNRKFGRWGWARGEALNVAIGQGITLVTPIQMLRYVGALSTDSLVTPHFGMSLIDPDGEEHNLPYPSPVPLPVDTSTLAIIRKAMVLVTEGTFGTAHRSAVPGYHVAGKTGTAQNPHGEDHSWYVGFVPADDPRIAIATICENAGHGSDIAAPISGEVLRAYMRKLERASSPDSSARVTVSQRPITGAIHR